ncbi:hypothetical protein VTP01DRAFT_4411 [Rhizomucor pusillus]|uniref:uncharacterized protein n=1 Tax=Rhizomucor pusillus TaxID=4840 RepID=UPI0037447FBB
MQLNLNAQVLSRRRYRIFAKRSDLSMQFRNLLSMFANFFFLSLLEQKKPIPPISHDLVYALFTTIAGQGCQAPESVKTAFKTFKSQIPAFDAKRFRSKGFMTLISQAAQEYEENVRNHITANMVKKTQEYIFVRLTNENDEFFITATVSEKKALAGHVCAVLEMEPGNEINIPKFIKDNDKLAEHSERIIKFLKSQHQVSSVGHHY